MLLLILLIISSTNSYKLYNKRTINEIDDQDSIYELINYYHNIDFSIDKSVKCKDVNNLNITNERINFNNNGYICIIGENNSTYYMKISLLYYKCLSTKDIFNCSEKTVLQECIDTVYKINMFIKKDNENVEFYNYINTSIISLDNHNYELFITNPFDNYYIINNKDIIKKKYIRYNSNNTIKDCNLYIKYKTPLYSNRINVIKFNENIYMDYNRFDNISLKNIVLGENANIYKSELNNNYYYYSIIGVLILLLLIFAIIIKKWRERKKKYVINKNKVFNKEVYNKNGEMVIIQNKKYKIKKDGVYKKKELIVKGLPKILFFKNYLKYSEENNGSIIDIAKDIIILKHMNNNLNILNLDYYLQKNFLYNNNNVKEPIAQINDDINSEIEIINKCKYNIENGNLYKKEKLLITKLYKY